MLIEGTGVTWNYPTAGRDDRYSKLTAESQCDGRTVVPRLSVNRFDKNYYQRVVTSLSWCEQQ